LNQCGDNAKDAVDSILYTSIDDAELMVGSDNDLSTELRHLTRFMPDGHNTKRAEE